MRAYIPIGFKPRLIKIGPNAWACHGVRVFRDLWIDRYESVTRHGETPLLAYRAWAEVAK
jgi:hypothetical protein